MDLCALLMSCASLIFTCEGKGDGLKRSQFFAGLTPLHHAACDEDEEFCDLLLSYGADIFAKNQEVST